MTWWHNAIGHPGDSAAKKMIDRGYGAVNGIKVTLKHFMSKGLPKVWCDTCCKARCRNRHHKRRDKADGGWPAHPNELHAVDSMGRSKRSLWGEQYSTVVKDHHDANTWAYAHRRKKEMPNVLAKHEHSAKMDARQSKSYAAYDGTVEFGVKAYRSDNAGELTSDFELARRRRGGIATQLTVPNAGHGQQNAVAERAIGLVRTLSNTLIHSPLHNIPITYARRLWPYADSHAARLRNLHPTTHNEENAAPAEKRYVSGRGALKPSYISRLHHIWGSRMVVNEPGDKRELKGRDYYYVGVPDDFAPGYLAWDLSRPLERPRVVLNVVFQEDAQIDSTESFVKASYDSSLESDDAGDMDVTSSKDVDLEMNEGALSGTDNDSGDTLDGGDDTNDTHTRSDSDGGIWNADISEFLELQAMARQPSDDVVVDGSESGLSQQGDMSLSGDDGGWSGRYFVPDIDGRQMTIQAIWTKLRSVHGMSRKIMLSEFRGENTMSNGEPVHQHARPPAVTDDGERGWLNIPTTLGEVDGESMFETTFSDSDSGLDLNDKKTVVGATDSDSNSSGGLDKQPEQEEAKATADGAAHNAAALGAFQRRQQQEFGNLRRQHRQRKWFKAVASSVGVIEEPADDTESLFEQANVLLKQTAKFAAKSVRVSKRRKKALHQGGKVMFKMANALLLLATANLVKGLEGIRARDVPEPQSYKEALMSDYAEYWDAAIKIELKNLEDHDIWEWTHLPEGRKCIDTTWRFKTKVNAMGMIDKLKARCCSRGFRQIFGIDYTETHAPVTVLSSWRANVADMAQNGWDFEIFDVKGAYLNAELLEEIYCKPPEGMADLRPGQVLRLKKALYGLKQAGRAWNKELTTWLKQEGFAVSDADPCLFIKVKMIEGEEHVIRMNVHVDDIFAVYSHDEWYAEFKEELLDPETGFELSVGDDANVYLGVSVFTLPDGAVKLCQPRYTDELVARYLPDDTKECVVPHMTSVRLTKEMGPQTEAAVKEMADVPYRSLIGALMHLANYTRPDIACAVGICAQYCANPGKEHWKAALTILRYLRGTRNHGLIYGRKRTECIPYAPLCGYADASWADNPDDRTSRTGTMLWSWGGPIGWRSAKQKSQALSTTEAEYMAACDLVKSLVWARRLLSEFGYDDLGIFDPHAVKTEEELEGANPSVVYEDNTGCIEWSRNPVDHQRSKHIDLRYHYVRAKVKDGDVKLVYCPTEDMVADLLTKYLAAPRFVRLRDMMVGVD